MKTIFEFKTLTEFTDYFCDEETCVAHFTASRFRNGEYCPHCRHDKIYKCGNGRRYQCAKCKQDFTIRTGTVFGESKLPLRKWYMAVYLLSTTSKGISSVQLAKHIGVTQKTAWFMAHRIRAAKSQAVTKLSGRIEADETYIGGKVPNMSKSRRRKFAGQTGGAGKTPLVGILQRGGEIQVKVAEAVNRQTLVPNIIENVQKGSFVYTDENVCYRGLHRAGFIHNQVQHQTKEYVVGDCHTNSIESFWALFKRGYHGVYHHMSKKHLQRYVNEFTFRFNRRACEMQSVFSNVVNNVVQTPQLPYKELIGKNV
ncbi:MAG TPA: IS1595 family transposase [Candidatus Aquilonibacter sp.]|nr:IS1595 family transposase [Candidatus Aquilonibacter sp.]